MLDILGSRIPFRITAPRIDTILALCIGQFRSYRKHVGHLEDVKDGEIYAKTVTVDRGGLLGAYGHLSSLMKKEGYYDQVRASMYFERPTDRRKRMRNLARWRRYREYISAKTYSAKKYYQRKVELDKYDHYH